MALQINTQSLNTLTVKSELDISYNSYETKNRYEIYGKTFLIETERVRDYGNYVTTLRLPLIYEWKYETANTVDVEFSKWARTYIGNKLQLAFGKSYSSTSTKLSVYSYKSERASAKCLNEAHNNGSLIAETLLVEIINKYVELLFADVEREVITRQINNLQSQLASIN